MSARAFILLASFGVCLLRPGFARAESDYRLDTSVSWGLTRAFASDLGSARESSSTNGGLGWSLRATLSLPHPVAPFVAFGSTALYRSDEQVDLGDRGGRAVAHNRLGARYGILGPAVPLGPVRVWAGLALYELLVESSVLGARAAVSDITMGYAAGATWFFFDRPALRTGVQTRVLLMSEAELAAMQVGLTLSYGFDL